MIEPVALAVPTPDPLASIPASITPPVASVVLASITGASFVPVIVTTTSWVSVPPKPSATVTVKLSVTLSPLSRLSAALLSML